MPSLNIGNSASPATNFIDFGRAPYLDNLAAGTALCWVYPVDVGTFNKTLINKISTANNNGLYFAIADSNAGDLLLSIARATTGLSATTGANVIVANVWQFIGTSWDINGANAAQKLYVGTRFLPAAEPTYASQAAGSGALNDDSANSYRFGLEAGAAPASPGFKGRVAWIGLWNRQLSLQEVRAQQRDPRPIAGCVHMCFPGEFGASMVRDVTGRGLNGVMNGTEVKADEGLIFPQSRYRRPLFRTKPAVATIKNRRTLTALGTRIGSRQVRG